MNSSSTSAGRVDFRTLLQGQAAKLAVATLPGQSGTVVLNLGIIIAGAGIYGAAMGWWRDPWQALFVAIKFPLILLLTALGNALLNGMLAPLMGLNISFRQSLLAILMSFAIAAAILGAFAPLAAFLVWNAPPMTPDVKSTFTYGLIKLVHVVVIAFAGIAGSARLFQLLVQLGGCRKVAQRVLLAWLGVNLFLGSQLTWIARPFIGSPQLPVVFLRDTAFQGNFYENFFYTVLNLLSLH
jgi:hypothetical protein